MVWIGKHICTRSDYKLGIYGYTGAYMGICGYTLYTTGVYMGIHRPICVYRGIQVCMNISLNTQKNKYTTIRDT